MQKWSVLFFLVAVSGCREPKKPDGVLTQTQLASLLVDIYLAEARADNLPVVKDTSIKYYVPVEQKLLKGRGISDSVLKATYSYYFDHPKELEKVYESVVDTLLLRKQRESAKKIVPLKGK